VKTLQHILIILVFAAVSCKTSKQSKSEMFPIITLERTTCYGTCPSYLFKAYPDGTVTYTGKEFTKLVGDFKSTISKEVLANLKLLFDEADYFSFANVYSANIIDLPTTYIYYDSGKRNAKITDYYGAPASLKKLEDDIDTFINGINWQKINQ